MERIQLLIQEIERFLDSNDLTDTENHRKLGAEYVRFCTDFNKKTEECQKLLERKMYVEANILAEQQVPSLQEQAQILEFPSKDSFLELFLMYGWEQPPELRAEVLEELKTKTVELKDLTPLLTEYRKVARSENIRQKIILLRQIVKLDSEKQEWKDTLRALEEQQLAVLTGEAKNAIIAKEYDALKEIQNQFLTQNWSVKPNEMVLNKISSVLADRRLEELDKLSAVYLAEINDAYSSFDYAGLEKSLQKWSNLLYSENYNPDEAAKMQVQEAEEYFLGQKKIKDEQRRFDGIVEKLRTGLEREAPAAELEMLYNQVGMMDREIPEGIRKRFLAYKEAADDIAARKKWMKIIVASVAACIVLAAGGLIAYTTIMNSSEREWAKRISAAIENETSAASLKLLAELEKNSPSLRQRADIQELARKADAKKQAEDKLRVDFLQLTQKIRNDLKNFSANRERILADKALALKLVVDGKEEVVYEELAHAIQLKMDAYADVQNLKYTNAVKQLRELRRSFFIALEKNDFSTAASLIAKSNALKADIRQIKDVSVATVIANKRHLDSVEQLIAKLEDEKNRRQKKDLLLAAIASPVSLKDLGEQIQAFATAFPDDPETNRLRSILTIQIDPGVKFSEINPLDTQSSSLFAGDAKKVLAIAASRKKILESAKQKFQEIVADDAKSPTFAVVLEGKDGCLLYDVYYTDRCKLRFSAIAGVSTCTMTAVLKNEEGATQQMDIRFKNGSTDIDFVFGETIFRGKLLYPAVFTYKGKNNELAPHVKLVQSIFAEIKKANESTIEKILHAQLYEILKLKTLNPYLKVIFAKQIMTFLEGSEMKTYKEMKLVLDDALDKIPSDYNWLMSYRKDIHLQRQLMEDLRKAQKVVLISENDFYRDFYETALTRKIIPIGYAKKTAKGLKLVRFPNAPAEGELWVNTFDFSSFTIAGTFAGDVIELDRKYAYPVSEMQILYTATDGRSSQKLTAYFTDAAKKCGIETIDWPMSWPCFAGERK